MTARPRRLLTVCLGNHCRSPLAALILGELGGPAVEVHSAGTQVGRPPGARADGDQTDMTGP
ncbi:low molecular weight phosphatase family protein [Streptomyces luomodiensis]|uniref:arsenate-mycothiol transferase ArsC n=1 Tax=Streptomyces luomodiensis TaxID=3026192 RepID=UPI003D778C85